VDIDPQKIIYSPLFTGLVGSMVALKFAPGESWGERLTSVSTGYSFAVFLAPVASEQFHLSSQASIAGMAFAVGVFGMSFAAAAFVGMKELKLGTILGDALSSWINKGGSK